MLISAKIHLRSFNKAQDYLDQIIEQTNVRYGVVKRNFLKDTGYVVLLSEKRFIDEVLIFLEDENYLTHDKSYFSTKYYA